MISRRVLNAVFVCLLLAGIGLLIPVSPAYLPSLLVHYSHYYDGHSLGYWVRALNRPDAELRRRAIFALGAIGPDAAEAVPALAQALDRDKESAVRMNAAIALFELGLQARSAVPVLIKALRRRANRTNLATFPFTIQEMAALALGRATAGTPDGVAALIEALESAGTPSKRLVVARALGEVGAPARSAEPGLRTLLGDDSVEIREAAAEALRKITGR